MALVAAGEPGLGRVRAFQDVLIEEQRMPGRGTYQAAGWTGWLSEHREPSDQCPENTHNRLYPARLFQLVSQNRSQAQHS